MAIEKWELLPSAKADRYLLKVRGDRADLEKVLQAHGRVCQEPREISDPVYQWAVFVVGASLNDRLALQDDLRKRVARPAAPAAPAPVDLSGVLAELKMVLDGFTGLTEEEQARVARKMEEIRQREEQAAAAPPAGKPPASVSPPAAPGGDAGDAAPADAKASPPVAAPGNAGEIRRPAAGDGPAISAGKTAAVPAAPSAPEGVPPDQVFRAAILSAPESAGVRTAFLSSLTEVAQKKAKKPLHILAALSQDTPVSAAAAPDWVRSSRSVGADGLFIILPPDLLPDYIEDAAGQVRREGLACFLVPQTEVASRLLYMDLMVELMLVKRRGGDRP